MSNTKNVEIEEEDFDVDLTIEDGEIVEPKSEGVTGRKGHEFKGGFVSDTTSTQTGLPKNVNNSVQTRTFNDKGEVIEENGVRVGYSEVVHPLTSTIQEVTGVLSHIHDHIYLGRQEYDTLYFEIDGLRDIIKNKETEAMDEVANATGSDGKALHSNDAKRQAALKIILDGDSDYKSLKLKLKESEARLKQISNKIDQLRDRQQNYRVLLPFLKEEKSEGSITKSKMLKS